MAEEDNNNADNSGSQGDAGKPAVQNWDELRSIFETEGLTPVQVQKRLEASSKWQGRAQNSYDTLHSLGITDEASAQAVKEKLAAHDKIQYDLASENEQKIIDARNQERDELQAQNGPRLVSAEIRIAAKGVLSEDQTAVLLEDVDVLYKKYLTATGDVDVSAIEEKITKLAPAKGTEGNGQQQRRGPSSTGQGDRGNSKAGVSTDSGRELYRSKHPAKK